MKRIFIALILTFALFAFALTACTEGGTSATPETTPTTTPDPLPELSSEETEGPDEYEELTFDEVGYELSDDPVKTVEAHLNNEGDQEYTISLEFVTVCIDDEETARNIENLKGSPLAMSRGWTEDIFDDGHFVVVYAEYIVEYDGTKVPYMSGHLWTDYWLVQDPEDSLWHVVDAMSPGVITAEKPTETDPFDPAVNVEFDSAEEYEQYLSELDGEGEAFSKEEIEAFISENYDKAYAIASFCRSHGADSLDIGADYSSTEGIPYEDGLTYECAPTALSSIEEFWEHAAEYFSTATVEQLKNAAGGYLLHEKDGVLYVAIGAKGGSYGYKRDTIEVVRQTEDRATLSIVKSFMYEGEKIALRELVKEDGQWKFDFIM